MAPSPYFLFKIFVLYIYNCLQSLMKFQQWLFKILRKQNITDGQTHTQTDGQHENSIPTTKFAGGIKIMKFWPKLRKLQFFQFEAWSSKKDTRCYNILISSVLPRLLSHGDKCLNSPQCFFSAVFGAEIRPHSPRQKVCFSPILKENSPQNEVFKKKKNRQNVTTACRKCV